MKFDFIHLSRRAILLKDEKILGDTIPAGSVINGANIPIWACPLVWLTPWHPKIRRGMTYHDYFWSIWEHEKGDRGFKRIMKEDGCNKWQVFWCYHIVKWRRQYFPMEGK